MAVEIKNLCKSFGETEVYHDFSLSLEGGKTTALLGPSGCGKTTLLKLAAGLLKPDRGEVCFPERSRISFLFQEDRLLPWLTVKENIKWVLKTSFSKAEAEERTEQALVLTGLAGWGDKLPGELSGGMQRRAACGRAVAFDGDLVLMDEPFKGLDAQLKETLLTDLMVLWQDKKKTILFVTHDESEAARMADCICRLSGRPVTASLSENSGRVLQKTDVVDAELEGQA